MKLPFWVQRSDFSAKTFPAVDAEGAVRAYESQDWPALLKQWESAKTAGQDCCEPAIGFSDNSRTLRISPLPDGEKVALEYIQRKRLLGFLPIPSVSIWKATSFPKRGLSELIRLFFARDHELVVAGISMYMPAWPESAEDVLAFIRKAEQQQKQVWSVTDYIKQADLGVRFDALPSLEQKALRRRIAIFFAELADQGLLGCREGTGSAALDDRATFDYVGASAAPATNCFNAKTQGRKDAEAQRTDLS